MMTCCLSHASGMPFSSPQRVSCPQILMLPLTTSGIRCLASAFAVYWSRLPAVFARSAKQSALYTPHRCPDFFFYAGSAALLYGCLGARRFWKRRFRSPESPCPDRHRSPSWRQGHPFISQRRNARALIRLGAYPSETTFLVHLDNDNIALGCDEVGMLSITIKKVTMVPGVTFTSGTSCNVQKFGKTQ